MTFNAYLAEVLISLNGVANITFVILLMMMPLASILYCTTSDDLNLFQQDRVRKMLEVFYSILFISFLIIVFFPTDENIKLLLGV